MYSVPIFIIIVGVLMGIAICALIWALIKPEKPALPLLGDKKKDRRE